MASGYFRAMQLVGFTECSGTFKTFWARRMSQLRELMGLVSEICDKQYYTKEVCSS